MNPNYAQILLQDPEVKLFLKKAILEKFDQLSVIEAAMLSERQIEDILRREISPEQIKKILDSYSANKDKILLERDLSAMCYQLNKSQNKVQTNTEWDKAYEHARNAVRITSVIIHFLGITNLNRNVPCPFHKDKSPSLRAYEDNNFFICFGCGARGSPVDFVMQYKNCSFKEAVLYLSNL